MKQIMTGLIFMHRNRIIHRDIKSENILVSTDGVLKFADFGLARDLYPPTYNESTGKMQPARYTRKVVTPYYRPPEVCLMDPFYDEKVDVWSTACVFAELLSKRPLFRGTSELDQLPCIFKIMISGESSMPSEEDWPGFRALMDTVYPNNSFP